MNFIAIPFLVLFFSAIFFIKYLQSKSIQDELDSSIEKLKNKLLYLKFEVNCEVYSSGAAGIKNYRFKRCDLKFLDDALLIYGYYKIGKIKIYLAKIVLTQNIEFYSEVYSSSKIIYPKVLVLNSYNNDIFIEFGESNFSDVNVQIRLKKITEEEKQYINI